MTFKVGDLVQPKGAATLVVRVRHLVRNGKLLGLQSLSGIDIESLALATDYRAFDTWFNTSEPLPIKYSDIVEGDKLKIVNDDQAVTGPAGSHHYAGRAGDQWLTNHGYALVNSNQKDGIWLLERTPKPYDVSGAAVGAVISYSKNGREYAIVKAAPNLWFHHGSRAPERFLKYTDKTVLKVVTDDGGKNDLEFHSALDWAGNIR